MAKFAIFVLLAAWSPISMLGIAPLQSGVWDGMRDIILPPFTVPKIIFTSPPLILKKPIQQTGEAIPLEETAELSPKFRGGPEETSPVRGNGCIIDLRTVFQTAQRTVLDTYRALEPTIVKMRQVVLIFLKAICDKISQAIKLNKKMS